MKETIKKLMIASFILGAFSAQAVRGGNRAARKLDPKQWSAPKQVTKAKIQEFNKLKTNLTAEQKKIVVSAIQALYSSAVFSKSPPFEIMDNLLNPSQGIIYSMNWEKEGANEKSLILFLQEFVYQSKVYPLSEALNKTLYETGLAHLGILEQAKQEMLENPKWPVESILPKWHFIGSSKQKNAFEFRRIKLSIEKMEKFWDLKEGPITEEKMIFTQGFKILTLFSGKAYRAVRETKRYQIMNNLLNPSQWVEHSLDFENHKISDEALRFVQKFIKSSEEYPFLEAVDKAMFDTGLTVHASRFEKRDELLQNPHWFLEAK